MTETIFSTGRPHQAVWLCYLNGLEIPIEAASLQFGVWQMPTATIRLTPHPILQRIGQEDRLQVALFFLDEFTEPDNPQFRLWGEYEVVGWGYVSGSRSRQLQLDCVAQVQIFKQMYFSQLGPYRETITRKQNDGVTIGSAPIWVRYTLGTDKLDSGELVGVTTKRRSIIRRPIDLVLHIFRSILSPVHTTKRAKTGETDPQAFEIFIDNNTPKGRVSRGVTSVINKNFFARWMKMTGFHRRWFALPLFEDDIIEGGCFPIIKHTKGYSALRSLQKHARSRKGSAWDLFMRIYPRMYMEIAMIPSPPAAAITKKTGKVVGKSVTDPSNQFRGLMTYFLKPQCLFSIPPMCNVMFPSMLSDFSFQESYITQPTRIKIKGGHGSRLARQLAAGTNPLFASIVKDLVSGYPGVVYKRAEKYVKAPGSNDDNYLIFPEEMFKGPVIKKISPPPWIRHVQKRAAGLVKSKLTDYEIFENEEGEVKAATSSVSASVRALLRKYAEYEFFRSRYEQRNGGASGLWNPFITPGFPGVVLDQRASGFDCYGYITAVAQDYSRTRDSVFLSTKVGMAFMRTVQEEDRDQIREPISSIRKILQDETNAEEFYRSLFFRKEDPGKPVIFKRDDVLETKNERFQIIGPTNEWEAPFKDYATAMNRVARPACTLKEYIETYHSSDIDSLLADGTVQGEHRSFYSVIKDTTPDQAYGGAVYWARIYKLLQGAGPNPGSKVTNIGDDENESPVGTGTDGFRPVDAEHGGMPQTRYDWDEVLELYRSILYGEGIGAIPQE